MDHWIQSKALKWIELNLLVGLQWQSFFSCSGGQNVHVHVQCNYWFTVYMYMYNIVSKFQKHYWCPHSFTPLFHFWTCHLIMRQHRLKSHSMMHAKCNSLGSPAQEEWEERRGAGAGSMIYGGRNDLTHPGRRGRERERESSAHPTALPETINQWDCTDHKHTGWCSAKPSWGQKITQCLTFFSRSLLFFRWKAWKKQNCNEMSWGFLPAPKLSTSLIIILCMKVMHPAWGFYSSTLVEAEKGLLFRICTILFTSGSVLEGKQK